MKNKKRLFWFSIFSIFTTSVLVVSFFNIHKVNNPNIEIKNQNFVEARNNTYTPKTNINSIILDQITNTNNMFNSINSKFANEFYSTNSAIGVYSSTAPSVLTDLINNNPQYFFDGVTNAGSLSKSMVDPSTTLAISSYIVNGSETSIKVRGNFLTSTNTYASNEIVISGFSNASTNVITGVNHNVSKELTTFIPEEAITKTDLIKDYINKNITSIFNNLPSQTQVKSVSCAIDPTNNGAIIVSATLNKYATNGVVNAVDSTYNNIKLVGFTPANTNLTSAKTVSASSIYYLLNSKIEFFNNIENKFTFQLVGSGEFASTFKTSLISAINNASNASIWFNNPVLDSVNSEGFPIIKASTDISISSPSVGVINVTGQFLKTPKNPNNKVDENSYETMTIVINGFNINSTTVNSNVSISSYNELSTMIVSEVIANKNVLLQFIKTNKSLFFKNYTDILNVLDISVSTISNNNTSLSVTISFTKHIQEGVISNSTLNKPCIVSGFSSPNTTFTSGNTVTKSQLNNIVFNTSCFYNIDIKYAQDYTNVHGMELYNQALTELKELINNKQHSSIFFKNPVTNDLNPNELPIIKSGTSISLSAPQVNNSYSTLEVSGKFLSRPDNLNNPVNENDYKDMTITISGFRTSNGTQQTTSTPIVNDPELSKLIVEQAISKPNQVEDYVVSNINDFLTYQGYYTKLSIIPNSLSIDPSNTRTLIFRANVTNLYVNNGNFQSEKEFTFKLTGFTSPNTNITSAKTIQASSLNDIVDTNNFLYNFNNKYAIEIQNNIQFSESFKQSIVNAINANPSFFFNNPISQSSNPSNLPIVKNNSITFVAATNSYNVYDSLVITGYFLTRSKNPNDNISEDNYQQMTITIVGLNVSPTQASPNGASVTGELANLITSEAKTQTGLIKTFIQNNINQLLLNLPSGSINVTSISNIQERVDGVSLTVDIVINKWINNNANIETTNNTYTVILSGFLQPNTNVTSAKSLSVSEIISLPNVSSFIRKLNTYYAAEITTNGALNATALIEFANLINTNPDVFLNNPVTTRQNPNNLPTVNGDLTINLVKNSNTNQYSNISISGNFLSQPKNPNATVTANDYIKMDINITGFKTGATAPSNGANVDGILATLTATEAQWLTDDIQTFINENISLVLNNSIAERTTATIVFKGTLPDINVLGNTLTVKVNVSYYADETSNIITNYNKQMTIILKGFAMLNDKVTTGKVITAETIAYADNASLFLSKLNSMFAIDLVKNDNIYGKGGNYETFNSNLISLINSNPEIFFENPVTAENNADGLSYVKQGTDLNVSISSESNIKNYTSLTVQGLFLTQPTNANSNVNESNYSQLVITITNFNANKTIANQSNTIQGYTYNKNGKVISPSDYTVNDFIYNNPYGDINISPKEILVDFVVKNLQSLFLNISLKTTFIDITSYELDSNDYSTINLNVVLKYTSVDGNGVLEYANTSYVLKVSGFKLPEDNPLVTTIKDDITISTLKNTYSEQVAMFPLLSNLNAHHAAEYTNKGFYYNEILLELYNSINTDPNVWFNNPVTSSINPNNLPIIKDSTSLSITTPEDDSDSGLLITGWFLTQPGKTGVPVNEFNDYQQMTIFIGNGVGVDTFINAGPSSVNTKYVDTSFDYDSTKGVFNLQNGYFKNSSLSTFDINTIEVENINTGVRTLSLSFINTLNAFFNSNDYRSKIFSNILNSDYTKIHFKSSWAVDTDNYNYTIDYINNAITIDVYLEGYYSDSGLFTESYGLLPYKITFANLYNSKNVVLEKSSSMNDIVFYSMIGFGVLIIILVMLIIYFKVTNNKKLHSDSYYDDFKE